MMRMLFNSDGFVVNLAEEIDMDEHAIKIGGLIVQMVSERPSGRHQALMDGTWEIPAETIYAENSLIENQWREEQMARVANQLLMIEDEDPDAEPGTRRQWMDYRIALRKWLIGSNPDFPDSTKRPVAPNA